MAIDWALIPARDSIEHERGDALPGIRERGLVQSWVCLSALFHQRSWFLCSPWIVPRAVRLLFLNRCTHSLMTKWRRPPFKIGGYLRFPAENYVRPKSQP